MVCYTDEAQRKTYLDQYEARLRAIEHEEAMPAHVLADFGPDWRLKPGIAARTAGHNLSLHAR